MQVDVENTKTSLDFPKIMESKGLIVLFSRPDCGISLNDTIYGKKGSVRKFSEQEAHNWSDFDGRITITQIKGA